MASHRYIILASWLLVAIVYFSLAGQWVAFSMHDQMFVDYAQRLVEVGASEQRPERDIRALLLLRAEDLSLPVRSDQIKVAWDGLRLKATVAYEADIKFVVLSRSVYQLRFQHEMLSKPVR